MPQLRKLSALPSSILPKIELGLDSVSSYQGSHPEFSTYLQLFTDMKTAHVLTSEAESDGADSIPARPRKRQRLDHLSQEEKIMRRKMKNRVAAQVARDRKKARMSDLEEQVVELERERKMLLLSNIELQNKNSALEKENTELKLRLGQSVSEVTVKQEEPSSVTESKVVDITESRLSDSSRSLEHAEGTGSANSYSLDDAIRLFTSNSETDALLDLLQQCSEDLLQCDDLNASTPTSGENRECELSTTEVVGTSPKSLESHKELIHFDHIYYKQEDDMSDPVDSRLSSSELSTKDSSMDISLLLEPTSEIEVPNTCEIPVICLTDSSDSECNGEELQLDGLRSLQLSDQMLYVCDSEPVASPISSDAGYDSSVSASSPSNSAVDSWDETLTELFPSLV